MVYIDSINLPFGRMVMCHMVADTKEELLSMADKIGVARKWIQKEGTHHEHFDVCLSKKAKAIKLGAKEITLRELTEFTNKKKEKINSIIETHLLNTNSVSCKNPAAETIQTIENPVNF